MASAGDSYIGSLISLISKYEIRYEGILYELNVQDSTIGLKNVKSFGTEGRKKDGPQVLPSDKVYEYILFRGSDIKDLQVKSSPAAKTEEQIPNDPAIIQSQYVDESFTSPPVASVGKDNLTGSTQWKDTPALISARHSGSLSSYNSSTHMGSEFSSVAPTTIYHQGYPRGFVGSLNPQHHINAQSPPTMSNPLAMQQLMQVPEMQASMSLGSASSSEFRTPVSSTSASSVNLKFSPPVSAMQYPTPLNVPSSAFTEASQPSHSISFSSNMSTMPTFPSHQDLSVNGTHIVPRAVPNPIQLQPVQNAPTEASPPLHSANMPNMPSLLYSHQDLNTNETQVVHTAVSDSVQVLPVQNVPYPTSSLMGPNVGPLLTPSSSLLRPDNSGYSGSQVIPSTQNLYASQRDMGAMVAMPSNSSSLLPTLGQAPLLPLPSSAQKFTEEFDFEAMNEKFKKDEVWDYLGKAKQVDKADGNEVNTAGHRVEEKEGDSSGANSKAAYNKDDFFDSISCNSLGHGPRKPQNRFPDRMRHNNDTFGYQQRPNPGYGGYGPGRGDNFRGGQNNWGRGYGYYGGRGRGGNIPF